MAGFNLDDYVDVAEREGQLFERYPDARVQVDLEEVRNAAGEIVAWKAKATIWRSPDDAVPVCDYAVEPFPGKTPYTKDSEPMNASTSAVGRAIVLAGFPAKRIASKQEVAARQPAKAKKKADDKPAFQPPAGATDGEESMVGKPGYISQAQLGKIGAESSELAKAGKLTGEQAIAFMSEHFNKTSKKLLTSKEASQLIEWLLNLKADFPAADGAAADDDIPF